MKRSILFVANPLAIHTGRWMAQLRDSDFRPEIWSPRPGNTMTQNARELRRLVRSTKPDIVHSLNLDQHSFVTRRAKEQSGEFPPWVVTDWGNGLNFFACLKENQEEITKVLRDSDFFWSECGRDNRLARRWGFRGKILPSVPVGGGFDLASLKTVRSKVAPARRRWILVKGYQNERGRALTALRALERCSDLLRGYKIGIYGASNQLASPPLALAAQILQSRTGVSVQLLPPVSHALQLRRHARARVSLGICLSDGISTSLLEAMIMGSYPIQSDTACAAEWIAHGKSGSIVPAEDPAAIEQALRKALLGDSLVNSASRCNWRTATRRLGKEQIGQKVLAAYQGILGESP